ncbi:hypothetical protein V8C35DRAFT_310246 [Trichoderma chlorosporum]
MTRTSTRIMGILGNQSQFALRKSHLRSMDKRHKAANARKACLRCRRSKRKCDRALPKCLLCKRREEDCQYETITLSSSGSVTPLGTNLAVSPDRIPSPQLIKVAIVENLSNLEPTDIVSAYYRTIQPWFPIIAEPRLGDQLPDDWNGATLDFTLLCLAIVLLSTPPESTTWADTSNSVLKNLYLSAKSWIALAEGIGANSAEIVQSRLFITVFEVVHGLYPAAYVSIGATARAAEALKADKMSENVPYRLSADEERVESCMTWAAIKALDRYIAIENGEHPPATRRLPMKESDLPYTELPFAVCPIFMSTPFSPQRQFLRLYEATNLLDQVHITIYQPTPRVSFNLEEGALLVNTLVSLRTLILEEMPEDSRVYASGLLICNIGLLLIYDKCNRERSLNYNMKEHLISATLPLKRIVEDVYSIIQPLNDIDSSGLDKIPPFVHFLIYKAANILTNNMRDQPNFDEDTRILKSLRDSLNLIQARWLTAGRYLSLLNEDTTPRIFRALDKNVGN